MSNALAICFELHDWSVKRDDENIDKQVAEDWILIESISQALFWLNFLYLSFKQMFICYSNLTWCSNELYKDFYLFDDEDDAIEQDNDLLDNFFEESS